MPNPNLTPNLTVDFTRPDQVLAILPNPPLRSSDQRDWDNIYVQQHDQPAWETPEYAHLSHMILVHGAEQVQAERYLDGRRQQEQIGRGQNIVIVPAQMQHQATWNQASDFGLLFLSPDYLMQVAHELTGASDIRLLPQFAMPDPLIDQMGSALMQELTSPDLGGRLFADSLKTALAVHLLRHYSDRPPLREPSEGLSPRKLQQTMAYIQAHLSQEISLAGMAAELGMSQYYFARLFKQSVGLSPYQSVMRQRSERAALLLRTTSLSVAAIAAQVGFASQTQLALQFRKFIGTTPSRYRRS